MPSTVCGGFTQPCHDHSQFTDFGNRKRRQENSHSVEDWEKPSEPPRSTASMQKSLGQWFLLIRGVCTENTALDELS